MDFFSGANLAVILKHWITQSFVIILISLSIDFVLKRVMTRIHKRLNRDGSHWYSAVLDAMRAPLSVFVWIVGIAFAIEVIQHETNAAIFSAIVPIRSVGIIAIIAWFLLRLLRKAETHILESYAKKGEEIDQTTADAISKIVRISIMITASLVTLQTLGFSISGVLAFGGIGGIALGFASKDLLANFFGGFMIYWDRPFKVGDWIRSPDREIEGTVETIGWRLTCIRTFDKRPLYVPNSLFSTISVENPSRMTNRRIKETIGVRYEDAKVIKPMLEEMRTMLQTHPDIDQSKTLMVNFDSFGESSLEFFIYTFTRTTVWTDFHMIKEKVLLQIYDIIAKHGADVAFPTSTIHMAEPSLFEQASLAQEKGGKIFMEKSSVAK